MKIPTDILSDKKEPPGSEIKNTDQTQNYITYVVQPGDTLQHLAGKFGTTCQTLLALNQLAGPTPLSDGRTLRIPENFEQNIF